MPRVKFPAWSGWGSSKTARRLLTWSRESFTRPPTAENTGTPSGEGTTWHAMLSIDPRDSNVLYVSTGLFDRDAANEDPRGGNLGGVGILKSTDGGKTWRVFNQANGLNNLYVGTLFMNPANPDVLLAGTGIAGPGGIGTNYGRLPVNRRRRVLATGAARSPDAPISAVEFASRTRTLPMPAGPSGVYRSNDMGRTWQKQTQGNFWGAPGTRAGFPIDFQVDPRNPDRIFANNYGGGNFLSEDGGKTWTIASQGYTGAYLHDIAVNPQDRDNIFVIGRTGPFRSYDQGNSWEGLDQRTGGPGRRMVRRRHRPAKPG